MVDSIKEEVISYLFKIEPVQEIREKLVFSPSRQRFLHPEATPMGRIPQRPPEAAGPAPKPAGPAPRPRRGMPHPGERETPSQPQTPYQREGEKTGRNDPCPCGSGKKYKKCCGRG
jgi:preprotein translocase subunit SecA